MSVSFISISIKEKYPDTKGKHLNLYIEVNVCACVDRVCKFHLKKSRKGKLGNLNIKSF